MREILFRAKGIEKTDNDKWYYGSYLRLDKTTYCFSEDCDDDPQNTEHFIVFDLMTDWGLPNRHMRADINPDTLCQFTGLFDKNGKKIWENDIVKYTFDSPEDPTATENGLKIHVGRIFWSEWRASFAVTAGKSGCASLNNDVARYVRGRSIYEYVRGANTVEVIGNIFDNPGLLNRD